MNRLALLFATTACALVATGCAAEVPAPPLASAELPTELAKPLKGLLDTSTSDKKSLVAGDVDWEAFDSTISIATQDCPEGLNVIIGAADPIGSNAQAVVKLACGQQQPIWFDEPYLFVNDNGWKLSPESFGAFVNLLAEPK